MMLVGSTVVAQNELVGYWPMDENSGSTVYDVSGYGNNGSASGTEIVSGCVNNARDFGSIYDFVTIPNQPQLNFAGNFTIAAWIKLDSNPSPEGKIIIKYESFSSNVGYEMSVGGGSSRLVNFQLGDPGENKVQSTDPLPLNECVFATGVRKGPQILLYINAQLSDTSSGTTDDQSNNSDIILGYRDIGYDQPFPGIIDEIRLFNIALSGEQIEELYESTIVDDEGFVLPNYFYVKNSPNPFNANTTIQYILPYDSDVRLEIFNILGQRVEKLLDTNQKSGQYSIIWDASGYSSGIYFYRLTTGHKLFTKRMTLLK